MNWCEIFQVFNILYYIGFAWTEMKKIIYDNAYFCFEWIRIKHQKHSAVTLYKLWHAHAWKSRDRQRKRVFVDERKN